MKSNILFFLAIYIAIGSHECRAQDTKTPRKVISEMTDELKGKENTPQQLFRVYNGTFQNLVNRGNYELADSILTITDQYISYERDSSIIMEYKSAKAFLFKLTFSFSKSLAAYLEVRNYYLSIEDIDKICLVDAQIAEFYRAQRNGEQCKKFIDEAWTYLKSGKVSRSTKSFLYSRMASFKGIFEQGSDDSVFYYSSMALDTALAADNKYVAALSQNELGFYYMNNYPEDSARSLGYYRAALESFTAEGRYRDCLSVSQNMARNYLYRGAYDKAIALLSPTIANAIENGWGNYLHHAYYIMSMSHNFLGNQSEVEKYVGLTQETLENHLQAQHAIEVGKLTASFEKEIAENALVEAEAEVQVNREALKYILVFSSILLLAIIMIARLFANTKKNNQRLKQQQRTIEDKNQALSQVIEEKETLYKELNHRVKNNLMVLSGLIYLQKESDENATPERAELYDSLRNRIQTMAIVHEKLYGNNGAAYVDFEDYLKELITLIFVSFTQQNTESIPFTISCMDLKLPIGQAIPLALTFNELITNSIKHGSEELLEKGIEITSKVNAQEIKINYTDSGKGIPPSFDLNESKTMGMRIIKLMIIQLKGKVEFPKVESGFKAEITLPADE